MHSLRNLMKIIDLFFTHYNEKMDLFCVKNDFTSQKIAHIMTHTYHYLRGNAWNKVS
ncbi:hypothetical protein PPIS_a2400 [Pseudoalteromonas piscicida]|uniref:Uncharacterized protein n=1 Tax=Pseudoalteromonas piscicida TaxID=43662 RepID=A0ABM6NES6_PSEO7|nr:hypothetical protein PPIS_a2400 [Pseudoalteromonas piscicida]